eukprot:SAG25_NODE_15_length_24441_cov_175.207288_13_plen_256_part_00
MAFLHEARGVLERVSEAVASAYGPLGCDRLVRPSERPHEVLLTSSGALVLESLRESHPVARVLSGGENVRPSPALRAVRPPADTYAPTYARRHTRRHTQTRRADNDLWSWVHRVAAVERLHALVGDGTTSLVLVLRGVLRHADGFVSAGASPLARQRRQVALRRALQQLKCGGWLDRQLLPAFRAHMLCTPTSCTANVQRRSRHLVRTLLGASLGGGAPAAEQLASLLCETCIDPWYARLFPSPPGTASRLASGR